MNAPVRKRSDTLGLPGFAAIVNAAMMREHGCKPEQADNGLIFNGY
jgi:hypothetical protein